MAYLGRRGALAPVTSADIPDNSITAAKIVDATIVAADLAPDSVDSSELVDGSVDLSHMSAESVDSDQYVDGSIDSAHLHTNAVFASGTKMLFNQTAAPTGWTKVTGSGNDTALRVTTGTVGTGGSVAFETAFASQTVPVHTLTASELPDHYHDLFCVDKASTSGIYSTNYVAAGSAAGSYQHPDTRTTGSMAGGSHGHGSIDLNVSYVDVIIATKD